MDTRKIMAGPFGTWLKCFLSTVLTMWIAMDDLWAMDMHTIKSLASAGVVSAMPIVLNALNPAYRNYGRGADKPASDA